MYVFLYMYVCIYVCMYVCMYICYYCALYHALLEDLFAARLLSYTCIKVIIAETLSPRYTDEKLMVDGNQVVFLNKHQHISQSIIF